MSRILLLLMGVVLIGVASFALVWFGHGRELQGPTARVLIQLRDGQEADVLQAADVHLRDGWSAQDLRTWWAMWVARDGRFVEIAGRRGYDTLALPGGERKVLEVDVGFHRRKVPGAFEFVDGPDGPRLVHLHLVDEQLGAGGADDLGVPEAMAGRFLDALEVGDWLAAHALLSRAAQRESTPRRLQQVIASQRALGERQPETAWHWLPGAPGDAARVLDAQVHRGAGNEQFRFRFEHAQDRWSIVSVGHGSDS